MTPEWLEDYWPTCRGGGGSGGDGDEKAIMCAYKLCKVEFRYWGMQSKIER